MKPKCSRIDSFMGDSFVLCSIKCLKSERYMKFLDFKMIIQTDIKSFQNKHKILKVKITFRVEL